MSAAPSRLELHLLGPVEVMVDGQPIDVDTKKATALLAYLAVLRHEQSRDHLADLLWPDADPERARAALRRTLSALRSGLGGRWVDADRSTVRFASDASSWLDVDAIENAALEVHDHDVDVACDRCLESLKHAARLVRGDFMEGFGLRGCPSFDDWMMAEAEHVRRRVAAVLQRLSTGLAAEGRFAEAIEAAERWLHVEPLHENAHRTVMLLHAWSGDRSGAVAAYRACVAVLHRELGVEPLEETTELYEAILEQDLPRAPAPARKPPPPDQGPARYPMVGRSLQLDQLRAVVATGHGLAIVEGEVGVGKTRLIHELTNELTASGGLALTVAAHRSEVAVAYGPLQSALAEALERPDAQLRVKALPPAVVREVARLVPALGDPAPVDAADAAGRTRFLEALAQTIGAMGNPSILCVDDLHWLDSASLELVAHVAHRLERLGVVLILTRRPEETPIDHPVSVLMEDLAQNAVVIRLQRLGADSVGELVRGTGMSELDERDVYERTRGLPFFVVEYLDAARAGRTELPAAVRRLVLSRLSDVDAVGRQLITTAAVVGAVADADMIRVVSGRSEDEVMLGLDDLIRRALLREREDGKLEFAHEQLREVAYEETSRVRRRLLHKRAAEYLASQPGIETNGRAVATLSAHHRAAGDEARAAHFSELAGRLAVEVFAFDEAIGRFEDALALGHPEPGTVLGRIGDIRTLLGQYGSALSTYEAARVHLTDNGDERGAAAVTRAIGEIYRRLRRWEMAAAAFQEAVGTGAVDDDLASEVAADWAFVEHRRGDSARATELLTVALERAAASGSARVLAHAHNLAGLLAADDADRIDHLGLALGHAVDPAARAAVLNNLARALADSGDVDGAVAHGRSALELAAAAGDRHRIAALHDNLAGYLHQAGDEEAAMSELKKAVSIFAEIGLERGALAPEVWFLEEW